MRPPSNASPGISKDRPSVVRCRRVHSRCDCLPLKACFRRFETGRTTACLRSAFTVFHRPDGLRLFDPARLLHRAANHGVPDVSKPLQPLPTRRSCPPKFSPRPWLSPSRLRFEVDGCVVTTSSPKCSPNILPSHSSRDGRPLLGAPLREDHRGSLKAFLQVRARSVALRCRIASVDTPLGLLLSFLHPLARSISRSSRTSS